jgi:uncharacterized membrane protein
VELKARWLDLVDKIRESYWFVPSLFALAGFGAGLLLVWLDALSGDAWLGRFEWLYGSRPAGARDLLSTVAGSTITVAGVVFSITLAAVTYASGQYGPRLLSNFVRDRGNQVTLGVFIGTFLYCLVVLRTVRSAEEASATSAGAVRDAFVPNLAIFGALAFAIGSIGVLIYFVHHVTDGIHINNVIARIGRDLLADIADGGREAIGSDAGERDGDGVGYLPKKTPAIAGVPIPARRTGYVEALDEDALVKVAAANGALLTVLAIPGDFVHCGRPLLLAQCLDAAKIDGLEELFSVSRKRSDRQDLRFPLTELVELAARALSPGVNDPFTAIACIDWLGAALDELSAMPVRSATLRDESGNARVIIPRLDFADYLEVAIGQLRLYAAGDKNVAEHLDRTLAGARERSSHAGHRALIEAERVYLAQASRRAEGHQ